MSSVHAEKQDRLKIAHTPMFIPAATLNTDLEHSDV